MHYDLLLAGGQIFTPGGLVTADLGVRDGRIAGIGVPAPAASTIDCRGLTVLPGAIDTQVHFREPGLTHKEDLESGSRAAVLGGIVAVFEMPNTNPNTDSVVALEDKLARARGRMWCDHAFYAGGTAANADQLGEIERTPGCCGVKVFMGSSTGNLLVADDAGLDRVLAHGRRRVSLHAEDEARLEARAPLRREDDPSSHPVWRDTDSALIATRRAVAAARRAGRRIHILHVSTPEELAFLADNKDIATVETTPNHLTLDGEEAYARLGTHAQMNPPVRGGGAREGLWHWLGQGVVDVVGSDHAPHTLAEKARSYPASPSGMPGVQTLLPLMLDHMAHGRLSLARLVDLTSTSPARIWGISGHGRIAVGAVASLSIVDLAARWTVTEDWLASRAGWSPFTGIELTGRPVATIVRGVPVVRDGALVGEPSGAPLGFDELA